MKHPIQPLAPDENGTIRFKKNKLVDHLLDHGQATGLGMNELAMRFYGEPSYTEDWQQLAQLIGYSLSGFAELSYVDNEVYAAAQALAEDPKKNHLEARIEHLEGVLKSLRKQLAKPLSELYEKHPDDFEYDVEEAVRGS